ncbi:hypothetical protein [Nocardioides ultimimeridianus]
MRRLILVVLGLLMVVTGLGTSPALAEPTADPSAGPSGSATTVPSAVPSAQPTDSSAEPAPTADPAPTATSSPSATPAPTRHAQAPQTPSVTAADAAGCTPISVTGLGTAPTTTASRGAADTPECFSFTTSAFGDYGIRVVSTSPQWQPYLTLSDGTTTVSSSWGDRASTWNIQLKGATTYQLLVSNTPPGNVSPDYEVGIYDLLGGTCAAVPGLGWTEASEFGAAVGGNAVDCRSFSLPAGRVVRITGEVDSTQVLNAAGSVICSPTRGSFPASCTLQGTGPYRIIGSSADIAAGQTERLEVTDTESDDGCTPITLAAWGSPLPALADRAADGRGAECYSITTTHAGTYGLRTQMADTHWYAQVELWEAGTDARLVNTSGNTSFTEVSLRGSRTYRFAVSGNPDGYPAGISLGLYDITQGAGCGTVPGLTWSSAPVTVDLTQGAVSCAQLSAPAATMLRLDSQRTSPEGYLTFRIYNAAGSAMCSIGNSTLSSCQTSGSGPYRVVAVGDSADEVAGQLRLTDVTSATGCSTVGLSSWDQALAGSGVRASDGSGAECYAITSGAAGTYAFPSWFASTAWSSRVQVWDTDSKSLIWDNNGYYWNYQLPLLALRQAISYRVVVSGDPNGYDGSYQWGLMPTSDGGTCASVTDLGWNAAPVNGTLVDGEVGCHQIEADAGSYVRLRIARTGETGQPRGYLVNKAGTTLCQVDPGVGTGCRLTGVGPFRVIVDNADPSDQTDYRLWVADASTDTGCTAPDESPAAAATSGTLATDSASACYALGTASGNIFIPARTDSWVTGQVVNGHGDAVCSTDQACSLGLNGPFHVVLTNTGDSTGSYAFRVVRPAVDNGSCTAVDSVAYGFPAYSGKLVDDLDVRCYSFTATTGDQLTFSPRAINGQYNPSLSMFGPQGASVCSIGATWYAADMACTANATGRQTVYVVAEPSSLGRYQLAAQCMNPACGPDELTVLNANPKSIGQSSSVTVTLQGKNFDASQTVTLERSGVVLTGHVIDVSSDRRTLRALFDLSQAAIGLWNVKVVSSDGETATYPGAVSVTGAGAPQITASLSGLGRFVPGRPQTISLSVTNSGNVDGIGVPLILNGFPAGSTVEPQFTVYGLDAEGHDSPASIGMTDEDTFTVNGSMGIPFFINRMPAGGRVDVAFRVTIPTQSNYSLTASVGQCMIVPTGTTARVTARSALPTGVSCANATYNALVDAAFQEVPGAACVGLVRDVAETGMTTWADSGTPFKFGGWGDALEFGLSTAFGAASCAADFFPVTKAAKIAITAGSTFMSLEGVAHNCYNDGVALGNKWVASMDPNEMVGPSGGGTQKAIRGEGKQHYSIYFENSKTASAPAQVVKVETDLDASKFDMSTLSFGAVQFGTTVWTPAESSDSLDHSLDLVSDTGLQLHITATKGDDGKVQWLLETIDPATGQVPEDPLQGFLPPDNDGIEGQGVLSFDVAYTGAVKDGASVSAASSIVFDLNAPISTNTWTNKIDRVAPTSGISGVPASTTKTSFPVTWTSAGTGSDVTGVDVYVADNGGSYGVWRTEPATGTDAFTGVAGHTYSFVAIAHDGAGNASPFPSTPQAKITVLRSFTYAGAKLVVKGTPKVGSTLKSNFVLSAVSPKPAKVTYQWYRGTAKITGAVAASYKVTTKDRGKPITLRITLVKAGYATSVLKTTAVKPK